MRLFAVAALALTVVALAAAAAAGVFGGSWGPARGVAPPLSQAQLQKLGYLALQAAALDGDAHPSAAFVVPTTRRIAEEVDAGDNTEPNTPAYFVLLQGHFTLANARIPPGAKAPTGTVLTLTFNRQANGSIDLGAGNRMPDLYAIGQPEQLPLPHLNLG
jgi:hypothetical protein